MFAFIACLYAQPYPRIGMFHPRQQGIDVLLPLKLLFLGHFPLLFVFVGHGLGAYLEFDGTTNNETIMHDRI